VALVRDLTDTMYNPKRKPFVDHFAGTDLVVEHIEKHWCPTVTSDQVLGGAPFRFAQSPRCDALPADAPAGPERDGSPVVLQATLGENACGPCAVVNTLLRARAPYADVLRAVEGGTPLEKAGGLVRRFGQAPSEAYAGEMAYVPKRGITWTDLTTCVNALLKERQAPPLEGIYLDRLSTNPWTSTSAASTASWRRRSGKACRSSPPSARSPRSPRRAGSTPGRGSTATTSW